MSPGYPKFYIGEMECKYIIKAPKHHRIRITLFDISLRSKFDLGLTWWESQITMPSFILSLSGDLPCRDFVEIEDVVEKRSLYSGCQEQTRPLSIVTGSHIARIKLTTTTKTAYPKRGVLLHYQGEFS